MILNHSADMQIRQKYAHLFQSAVYLGDFMNQNPCHVASYILGCQCMSLGEECEVEAFTRNNSSFISIRPWLELLYM